MNKRVGYSSRRASVLWGRAWIYLLLVVGSAIFLWPFVWMVGTSVKLNREIFDLKMRLLPEAPVPRPQSPYVDARPFREVEGPQMKELLPHLQEQIGKLKYPWPKGLDQDELMKQVCLGCYQRLRLTLPEESWKLPLKDLSALALKQVNKAMVDEGVGQVWRGLLIGQLRVRSMDLQED